MDVATLCKNYQRKMWKSMISRKKLDINIWDAIEYKNENVYYMPYNSKYKFLVNNRYCLQCKKELDIGFRKNEFIIKTCKCSTDNKNYVTKKKLTTIFSNDDADKIIEKFNNHKTRRLPNKLKYWTDQGFSECEAKEKVCEIQKNRSEKSLATKKGNKDHSVRTKEFWIKKGYTESEAAAKVSNIQVTNGLDWYISRYGEVEGEQRYKKRINSWLESYKKALENDPTINKRKMVSFCSASKESLKIFLPLFDKYKDEVRIYLGIKGNNEYFLRNDKTIYFYDFTIPSLKIIAEYNGSKFHPNPCRLTEDELNNWKSLFKNEPASLVIAKDNIKKKVAEHNGYTVITVWDTDDINESIDIIDRLIKERLNAI